MKKVLFGVGAVLLLTGVPAYSAPFITVDTFGASSTIGSYSVYNYKQASDIWKGNGYIADNDANTDKFFSGLYIGTVDGNNDKPADLTFLLNYFLGVSDTYTFIKVDEPKTSDGNLSVSYNDLYTGTWELSGGLETMFYSVKGGTGYSLYYVNPAQSDGAWTTAHLRNDGGQVPEISHLTVQTQPGTPIPEPTTMLLFGTGLLGLAGLARRKRN